MEETPSGSSASALTFAAVADFFGCSPRQVARWKADGCDGLQSKPYDLARVATWLEQREAARIEGAPGIGEHVREIVAYQLEKARWEAQKAQTDARIRALQLELFEEQIAKKRGGHDA